MPGGSPIRRLGANGRIYTDFWEGTVLCVSRVRHEKRCFPRELTLRRSPGSRRTGLAGIARRTSTRPHMLRRRGRGGGRQLSSAVNFAAVARRAVTIVGRSMTGTRYSVRIGGLGDRTRHPECPRRGGTPGADGHGIGGCLVPEDRERQAPRSRHAAPRLSLFASKKRK